MVPAAGSAWPVRCAVWGSPCCSARGLTCPLGPEHMWCRASPRVVLDGQMALLLPCALACFSVMAGSGLRVLAPGLGRRSCCGAGHSPCFHVPALLPPCARSVHTWPNAQLDARAAHREV